MFNQGTLLQHGDSQRGLFTKVKSKHIYFKNAYKDKISQTKFQRKTSINIVHKDKVWDCNLTSLPMKVDRMRLEY